MKLYQIVRRKQRFEVTKPTYSDINATEQITKTDRKIICTACHKQRSGKNRIDQEIIRTDQEADR